MIKIELRGATKYDNKMMLYQKPLIICFVLNIKALSVFVDFKIYHITLSSKKSLPLIEEAHLLMESSMRKNSGAIIFGSLWMLVLIAFYGPLHATPKKYTESVSFNLSCMKILKLLVVKRKVMKMSK